ncbi:MAG: orotate phosphoribosyltransferase [Oscillospiraceae bacterium]|nr:orotate phosphoribosyltransferase [Oscillospiraceae bacterium]
MEDRAQKIEAKKNNRIAIEVIPGHYATNHSHVNYYVDMTAIKTSMKMAKDAAHDLGMDFANTYVDTIICLEGTEILGAFLADTLSQSGINQGKDISLVTPELNAVNQMIFRDNTQKKIWGKKVLLLISSASTGKSINRAIDCLQYYSGELVAVGAIFSAIEQVNGIEVKSLFTDKDLPHYDNYLANECPMCKNGIKVDALINSFGYSKL